MLLRRPSLIFSLMVTVPLTIFYGAVALVLGPIDLIFFRHYRKMGKLGPVGTWVKINWCRSMLVAHGIELQILGPGAKALHQCRGTVFVANHQSTVDILALMHLVPPYSSFIAKRELRRIPIFGWAAWIVGTVFINRERGTQNRSLMRIDEVIKSGLNLVLFPEGTRSRDGKLLAFKRGAFVLAIQTQAPIMPISIFDSRLLAPKGQPSIGKGRVHIWVDSPISTKGLTYDDRHALCDRVRDLMSQNLETRDPKIDPQLWLA